MNKLHISLLGAFSLTFDHQPLPSLATDKVRALLAYVALQPETAVRRERLAGLLWPDQTERLARQNLRQTLHRLRRALKKSLGDTANQLLLVDKQTVTLNGALAQTDVAQFETLLDNADRLADLETAVSLYRDELLAGFSLPDAQPFEEWLLVQRERLHQKALLGLDQLTERQLDAQRFAAAQETAQRQLALEPWRERGFQQLMRIALGMQQYEQAVAIYQRCEQVLAEELGVEPSSETKLLLGQVEQAQQQSSGLQLHDFPSEMTLFVGREKDLAELTARLLQPESRLVTILGAGGVGKTRLAVHALHQLPPTAVPFDAAYFVSLTAVSDPTQLATTIGAQIGLIFDEKRPYHAQLTNWFASRTVLLVLDNYEQLLPNTTLISQILHHTPTTRLLVTSRSPLNLQAEWRLPLRGLPVPPPDATRDALADYASMQLLYSMARQGNPTIQLDATLTPLCRLLAGLPLALEIAGSWLSLFSPQGLTERLANDLDFLVATRQDVPERHRSLRLIFDYSWRLLNETAQQGLAALAYFATPFSLVAARQVTQIGVAELTLLIDHALVQRRKGLLRLHPLLREFAREKLNDAEQVQRRHAVHFLEPLVELTPKLSTPLVGELMAELGQRFEDVQQAWAWAVAQQEAALIEKGIKAISAYFQFRGLFFEGKQQFATAAAAFEHNPEAATVWRRLRVAEANQRQRLGELSEAIAIATAVANSNDPHSAPEAAVLLGTLHRQQGSYDDAMLYLTQALVLLGNEEREKAAVLNEMGQIYRDQNEIASCIDVLTQALRINRALGNKWGTAENHANLGLAYKDRGNYREAIANIEAALALAKQLNHQEYVARFTQNLGLVYWQMDELDKALAAYQEALRLARIMQHKRGIAMCLGGIGTMMRRTYQFDEALNHYQQAYQLSVELSDATMQGVLLGNMGNALRDVGRWDEAIRHFNEAMASDRRIGVTNGVYRHMGNMAQTLMDQGKPEEALPYLEEAMPEMRQMGMKYYLCWQLVTYANCLLMLGRWDEAAVVNEEGGAIAREIGRLLHMFESDVVRVKLLAARGDGETAVAELDLLEELYQEPEQQAELAFLRWRLTEQLADRDRAQALLLKVSNETGLQRFKTMLRQLS